MSTVIVVTDPPTGSIVTVVAKRTHIRHLLDGGSGVGSAAVETLCRHAKEETRESVEAGVKRALSGRASGAPVEITVGEVTSRLTIE